MVSLSIRSTISASSFLIVSNFSFNVNCSSSIGFLRSNNLVNLSHSSSSRGFMTSSGLLLLCLDLFNTFNISYRKKSAQMVDHVIQRNVIRTNNIRVQSSSRHNIVCNISCKICMPIYTEIHIQHQKWSIHKLRETFSVSICEPRAKHNSLRSAVYSG